MALKYVVYILYICYTIHTEVILMTIEQLTYFLALNTYKNFSIASDQLCISQSSLSKHIKALESELNTTLFNRNTRSISLTPSGQEFLKYAEKAIADYNRILLNFKKQHTHSNILNIGAIPVTAQYKIISAMAEFKTLYPYIHINLLEDENYTIINKLMKSEIHLGIVRDFNLSNDVFNKLPLVDDELVVVVSKNHPLAKKTHLSLLDIKDEPFILLGPNSGIYERCINEFNKHSLPMNISATFYKVETILALVSENFGITLIMKEVLNAFNTSNIRVIPMTPTIKAPLSLVTLKNSPLSMDECLFKDFIKNILAKD